MSNKKDEKDFEYNGKPTSKPTFEEAPTLPTFNKSATSLPSTNTTSWDKTAKGEAALGAMSGAADAVKGYGDFTYSQQGWLNDILKNIKNYGEFSYDMNGDALYQQYKDKFVQQGKLAMADTMGQAAAMTGGYGNSYAQSAGQQAYQGQLQNLNDIVPELAQMAYDRWNQGKQDLYNQYGLASSERENEYGLYQDKYGRLMDAYGIASDDYYRGADLYHAEQNMKNAEAWNRYNASEDARQYANSLLQQGYQNEFGQWDAENKNKQWLAEWDESLRQDANDDYWKAEQFAYDKAQDELAQQNWEKQFNMQKEAWDIEKKTAGYPLDEDGNVILDELKPGAINDPVDPDDPLDIDSPLVGQSRITTDMRKKAAEFTDNESLASWAEGLVQSGVSQEEADLLVAEFLDQNEKYVETEQEDGTKSKTLSFKDMVLSDKGWTVASKGGANLFGIDNNAKVIAPNGETMRLDQLRDKLIAEGMEKDQATKAIKGLQQKLGISSNWLFGW